MITDSYRVWVALGAFAGLLAVAAAAGAAHLPVDAGQARAIGAAVQMQGWHALALVGCGIWGARGGRLVHAAGAAFAVGALLFCGTVYAGALGGPHLGVLAPVGGSLLMLGWLLLGLSAVRR
jgi:uncharacterized membrane protein YgdD (TMEM256/DUF423 family)